MDYKMLETKKAFFEAMLQGWANPDAKKNTLPRLPGSKSIRFQKGKFIVLDWYLNGRGAGNMGNTIIWEEKEPIWMMSYGGWYREQVIPFLKEALLAAYRKSEFNGGRGPNLFMNDDFVYVNNVVRNKFDLFLGEEKILGKKDGTPFGWHHYWGKSLIPTFN